jgi:hypothetical protein
MVGLNGRGCSMEYSKTPNTIPVQAINNCKGSVLQVNPTFCLVKLCTFIKVYEMVNKVIPDRINQYTCEMGIIGSDNPIIKTMGKAVILHSKRRSGGDLVTDK